jgi:5-methylcytosine-specific restriction endonuclease McrA
LYWRKETEFAGDDQALTKIIFGINVPFSSSKIDWEATDAKRKEMGGYDHVRVPCIRHYDKLFFEICDTCGEQVIGGRLLRGLPTCSPACHKKKKDGWLYQTEQRERSLTGERPKYFWWKIRDECFKRDNHACQRCGVAPRKERREVITGYNGSKLKWTYEEREITIDPDIHAHHIIPISQGGSNDLSNLITLCYDCHKKEHSRTERIKRQHVPLVVE